MIFASFDLDGVLADSNRLIIRALKERGYIVTRQTSFDYKFESGKAPPPDFQWDVFFYRLFTERFDELELMDDNMLKFIESVYGDGSEPIKVITSRPKGLLMHYSCEKLLERLYPGIDFSIDIVENSSEKVRYMHGNDIFFDDRRRTGLELAKTGKIVFMPNTCYNCISNESSEDFNPFKSLTHASVLTPEDFRCGTIIKYDTSEDLMSPDLIRLLRTFD